MNYSWLWSESWLSTIDFSNQIRGMLIQVRIYYTVSSWRTVSSIFYQMTIVFIWGSAVMSSVVLQSRTSKLYYHFVFDYYIMYQVHWYFINISLLLCIMRFIFHLSFSYCLKKVILFCWAIIIISFGISNVFMYM